MPEMITNHDPEHEQIQVWGVLAYVSAEERSRIMCMPLNERSIHMEALKREVYKHNAKRRAR